MDFWILSSQNQLWEIQNFHHINSISCKITNILENSTNAQIRSRKSSQIVQMGNDNRMYTPDQLQQIYNGSIIKYKATNLNSNWSTKNGKKMKRGVKTSYGNYTYLKPQSSFGNNNRKSLASNGNSHQNTFHFSPKILDSLK